MYSSYFLGEKSIVWGMEALKRFLTLLNIFSNTSKNRCREIKVKKLGIKTFKRPYKSLNVLPNLWLKLWKEHKTNNLNLSTTTGARIPGLIEGKTFAIGSPIFRQTQNDGGIMISRNPEFFGNEISANGMPKNNSARNLNSVSLFRKILSEFRHA